VLASLLGGCMTAGNFAAGDATLAFESIDGAPRQVFDRLTAQIDAQAKAQRVAVVSREGRARYHVRAYLAATVTRGKTAVNWVWDVYDSDGHRVMRLSGQEPAGVTARDAWADADDRVIGRIAQSGMQQLAAFTSGTPAERSDGGRTAVAASPAATAAGTGDVAAGADVQVLAAAESTAAFDRTR
jgi:hypothetical protein